MGLESYWFGAALIGILASCWSKIRMLMSQAMSLFFVQAKVQGFVGMAVAFYCYKNLKRSPFGSRKFDGCTFFVNAVQRFQIVGYEEVSHEPTIFWDGFRPISLVCRQTGNDESPDGSGWSVSFIRGTFDIDAFLIKCLDALNAARGQDDTSGLMTKRFEIVRWRGHGPMTMRVMKAGRGELQEGNPVSGRIDDFNATRERRVLRWRPDELGQRSQGSPWASLAFPPSVRSLIDELGHWLKSEQWYRSRQIPWRFGWLLHGQPGTGKTSIVRALGQHFDLPVISFDLATFGNDDFSDKWRELMGKAPCIALLEDIDAVFDGRDNRLGENGGGLTFDCLLNCLSGIEVADGVFTIITTNRLECIDPALGLPETSADGSTHSSRPGRIDRVIELPGELDHECRRRIAERILADCQDLIDEIVESGQGDSGAQFQDRCAKIALEQHWQRHGNGHGRILSLATSEP